MLGERDDVAVDDRQVLAADRPQLLLRALLERRARERALAPRRTAARHQHPPVVDGRALQVRVGGDPRLARRLLLEQPAGREAPAHQPRARGLVAVLADQQRAGRVVDRGVGEAQVLALRPVPAGLGEGAPREAPEVEQPQPLVGVGDVQPVLAPGEAAGVGLDRLAVGQHERDVAVAAAAGVGDREPRGAVELGVPGDEHDVPAPVDALRIPVLRLAVLRVPAEAAAQPARQPGGERDVPARAEAPQPAVEHDAAHAGGPAAGRGARAGAGTGPGRSRAVRRRGTRSPG